MLLGYKIYTRKLVDIYLNLEKAPVRMLYASRTPSKCLNCPKQHTKFLWQLSVVPVIFLSAKKRLVLHVFLALRCPRGGNGLPLYRSILTLQCHSSSQYPWVWTKHQREEAFWIEAALAASSHASIPHCCPFPGKPSACLLMSSFSSFAFFPSFPLADAVEKSLCHEVQR